MTCVVRIEALRALGALIEASIPELAGRVCVGVAPSSHVEELPNLSIEPSTWRWMPDTVQETVSLPGNRLVYNMGTHEAGCVLSIVTATPGERWTIEAKVIDLFMGRTHPLTGLHMPGVIVLAVTACPELAQWACSFDLDTDEWVDTAALDRRYESRIMVTATIPALTVAAPVYTIEQLLLGVQQLPPAPSTPVPPVELVSINVDGTFERVTP